jgi:glycosyltransferase involved in cell wall biosynthesis
VNRSSVKPIGPVAGVSISAFFPAYNDAPSLPVLIEKSFRVLKVCAEDYEVIVIKDGSRDETAQVLEALEARLAPRLRVITHPRNLGYGQALRSGFASATKDLVFYTDGDGQYDVGELTKLLHRLTGNVGLVNGYKKERNDPWHRICIGHVYNRFARRLFRIGIRDVDCDFRLIRRTLLNEIELTSTSGTICVELIRKLELTACEVDEVGVRHYPRRYGRSQFFRLQSLAVTFVQPLRLWFKLVLIPGRVRGEPAEAPAALR